MQGHLLHVRRLVLLDLQRVLGKFVVAGWRHRARRVHTHLELRGDAEGSDLAEAGRVDF